VINFDLPQRHLRSADAKATDLVSGYFLNRLPIGPGDVNMCRMCGYSVDGNNTKSISLSLK